MTSTLDQAASLMPFFTGPTQAEVEGAKANAEWWDNNRPAVAGVFRMVSHGALIGSGLGIGTKPSGWRAAAGVSGLSAASMLAMYGAKPSGPMHDAQHNVIGNYAGINIVSGLCLFASGLKTGRQTEAFAGAWTTTAFAIKKWMPENGAGQETSAPHFDENTPTHTKAQGLAGQAKHYMEEIQHRPVKLGADMLQVSAVLVMTDAIMHRDPMRAISAVCLAASNYAIRESKRSDYAPPSDGTPGR